MVTDPFKKARARVDFDKAKNRAFFGDMFSRITNKNNALLQFDEVKHMLSPQGMVYRGLSAVPLDKIIGSQGRYSDFDKNFMPRRTHNRSRWENVDILHMDNVELPPVELYKLGEHYFVKDGNHRVSVAREKGQEFIDAQIVELFSNVELDEDAISEKGLLLAHSKKYFLDSTRIDILIPESNIKLTNAWAYYRLLEHINDYKYLLSEKEGREFDWEESVQRWFYDMYSLVVFSVNLNSILKSFPGRTEGDLYIWVMDHWHFLKEKYANIDIEEAVIDYSARFGQRFVGRFFHKIGVRIKKILARKKK